MRIVDAVERTPIAIRISDVIDADGSFSFVPEVKSKGYFDIDFRKNELVLVAGRFIGEIPLTSELSIFVRPKVPLANLARIISIAQQPIHALSHYRRSYKLSTEASDSVFEAMARSLVSSLRELDAEGVFREYLGRLEVGPSPRGRIDFAAYAKSSMARGRPLIAPYHFYVLSADTPYNRVIKLALWVLGSMLARQSSSDIGLLRELQFFYSKFESVRLEAARELVPRVEAELSRRGIPNLRHYYTDILDVCLLVLRDSIVEISSTGTAARMSSFLLNLEDTFERYIREVLRQSSHLQALEISVGDGNKEARGKLFDDTDAYDAKPDYVLKRNGSCIAIGDAKYKLKLAEDDRYQLISHALAFRATQAFTLIPARSPTASGPAVVGTIGGGAGILLQEYRFNLDADSLAEEEARLCAWVGGLSGTS